MTVSCLAHPCTHTHTHKDCQPCFMGITHTFYVLFVRCFRKIVSGPGELAWFKFDCKRLHVNSNSSFYCLRTAIVSFLSNHHPTMILISTRTIVDHNMVEQRGEETQMILFIFVVYLGLCFFRSTLDIDNTLHPHGFHFGLGSEWICLSSLAFALTVCWESIHWFSICCWSTFCLFARLTFSLYPFLSYFGTLCLTHFRSCFLFLIRSRYLFFSLGVRLQLIV